MRWLATVFVVAGCVNSGAVHCEDGRTCPGGTICDDTHAICVTQAQLDACVGATNGTPTCFPGTSCNAMPTCGDGYCDPSNETCSACPSDCSCTSVCGDFICESGETGCPGDCP